MSNDGNGNSNSSSNNSNKKKKPFGSRKGFYIRFGVGTLLTMGLTAVLLWTLLPVYDPGATLKSLQYDNKTNMMHIEVEMLNRNYLRGYNYTEGAFIEVFTNLTLFGLLDLGFLPFSYEFMENIPDVKLKQGFHDKLTWNFTLDFSDVQYFLDSDKLTTKENHLYVSLFLKYHYKIMLWQAKTDYYQWLNTHAYLGPDLKLNETGGQEFTRTSDLIDDAIGT